MILKSKRIKPSPPYWGLRRIRLFRPILLTLFLFLLGTSSELQAQIFGSVSLTAGYSDNAFQLSEYDLSRYDGNHNLLSFVETTDDMTLGTRIELAYPLHYRWWKITPSVIGNINQNLSNTDKYRRDATVKLQVDRYYWSLSAQYAYHPHIYFRDFSDGDGTDELQNYSYSRDIYRTDISIRPLRSTSLKANYRQEDFRYNEFFTEADGTAFQGGLGINQRFPAFTIDAGYDYRAYDNENLVDDDDASYDANIYHAKITLPQMPISDTNSIHLQPSLALNYQQRYYQGDGSWYGGRADYLYTMTAGFMWTFSPKINLSLDYSHIFRSVESDNADVLRLKEYSENRFGAALKYKF